MGQQPGGPGIARKAKFLGAVHFGLTGKNEAWTNSPCAIGKWGISEAPDWPWNWDLCHSLR